MSPHPSLTGLSVFERGWLSSNNILIHPAAGEDGAVLVDTGHVNHAAQTLELVRHGLRGQALAHVFNTHLHSDHCGGNAALRREFGVGPTLPPGQAAAVRAWDEDALSYKATGQRIERFEVRDVVVPGQVVVAGGRQWQVLAAPGHDPHSVMWFDADGGVLLSADALWENGFGVVFPEVAGEPGFDDVGQVLDLIETLPVRVVIPGHGAPFTDGRAALERARRRLAGFRADPLRHARHAVKVLIKYHVMEERQMPLPDLLRWADAAPLVHGLRALHPALAGADGGGHWIEPVVRELVAGGALALNDEGVVLDI